MSSSHPAVVSAPSYGYREFLNERKIIQPVPSSGSSPKHLLEDDSLLRGNRFSSTARGATFKMSSTPHQTTHNSAGVFSATLKKLKLAGVSLSRPGGEPSGMSSAQYNNTQRLDLQRRAREGREGFSPSSLKGSGGSPTDLLDTHLKKKTPSKDRFDPFAPRRENNTLRNPSQRPVRRPKRRAVVVGINYVIAPDIVLRGCCNDAVVMAQALINLCDFKPEDVILLIDSFPSSCYRSVRFEEREEEGAENFMMWKDRQPTRRNILLALNWLRADTLPGDVLFFYFAGHGIQVDDMSGWEGEGYDEAILPMDFYGEEVNALTAVMIRNLLLSICNDVQLTIVLDCAGGQTMLDPSGTGGWSFIKGVKQKGVWPFITDATDKVAQACYDSSVWVDESMKRRGVRPRFVPGVNVSSTQDLLDPTLQRPAQQMGSRVKGFLFAGAPWSQVAVEAKMPAIELFPINRSGKVLLDSPVTMQQGKRFAYHGVFSWSFLMSLKDLLTTAAVKSHTKAISYHQLIQLVQTSIKCFKSKDGGLPKLSQIPELTYYRAGGGDVMKDLFLWPYGGQNRNAPFATGRKTELPCIPHETRYLSPWEAEGQLHQAAELKRENDPALKSLKRMYMGSPQQQHYPHSGVRNDFGTSHSSVSSSLDNGNVRGRTVPQNVVEESYSSRKLVFDPRLDSIQVDPFVTDQSQFAPLRGQKNRWIAELGENSHNMATKQLVRTSANHNGHKDGLVKRFKSTQVQHSKDRPSMSNSMESRTNINRFTTLPERRLNIPEFSLNNGQTRRTGVLPVVVEEHEHEHQTDRNHLGGLRFSRDPVATISTSAFDVNNPLSLSGLSGLKPRDGEFTLNTPQPQQSGHPPNSGINVRASHSSVITPTAFSGRRFFSNQHQRLGTELPQNSFTRLPSYGLPSYQRNFPSLVRVPHPIILNGSTVGVPNGDNRQESRSERRTTHTNSDSATPRSSHSPPPMASHFHREMHTRYSTLENPVVEKERYQSVESQGSQRAETPKTGRTIAARSSGAMTLYSTVPQYTSSTLGIQSFEVESLKMTPRMLQNINTPSPSLEFLDVAAQPTRRAVSKDMPEEKMWKSPTSQTTAENAQSYGMGGPHMSLANIQLPQRACLPRIPPTNFSSGSPISLPNRLTIGHQISPAVSTYSSFDPLSIPSLSPCPELDRKPNSSEYQNPMITPRLDHPGINQSHSFPTSPEARFDHDSINQSHGYPTPPKVMFQGYSYKKGEVSPAMSSGIVPDSLNGTNPGLVRATPRARTDRRPKA